MTCACQSIVCHYAVGSKPNEQTAAALNIRMLFCPAAVILVVQYM